MHNELYHHLSEPCSPQPFINSRLHDATACNEITVCECVCVCVWEWQTEPAVHASSFRLGLSGSWLVMWRHPSLKAKLKCVCVGWGGGCFTEDLADVGVVHVREGLQNLSPLVLGPNHEGVHRPLDVWLAAAATPSLPEYSGVWHTGGAWGGERERWGVADKNTLTTNYG